MTPTSYPTLTDPATGKQVPATITQTTNGPSGRGTPQKVQVPNPAWQALQKQANAAVAMAEQGDASKPGLAPGLQWVNQAAPAYNDLIQAINDQLGKLGSVGVPSLTYSPTTLTDPVTGISLGKQIAEKVPGDVGLATGLAGTASAPIGTALAAAGGASAADAAIAAGQPVTQTMMLPPTALGGLSPAASILPAAVAGYGAQNIARNELANPIKGGLETLGNMGLTLATMSLPPKIFESIGKEINSVLNDIGSFFSGLF